MENVSWYMVNVCVLSVNKWEEHIEHIKFKSLYAARYMAKQYYDCADVQSVEVIDQMTGEIMYSQDANSEYDSEG